MADETSNYSSVAKNVAVLICFYCQPMC